MLPNLLVQSPNQLEWMRMYNLYHPQGQRQQLQQSAQMSQTITTPSQTPVQPTTNTPTTTNIQTPSTTTLPAIRQPTDLFGNPITPTQPPQKKQKKARFSLKKPSPKTDN